MICRNLLKFWFYSSCIHHVSLIINSESAFGFTLNSYSTFSEGELRRESGFQLCLQHIMNIYIKQQRGYGLNIGLQYLLKSVVVLACTCSASVFFYKYWFFFFPLNFFRLFHAVCIHACLCSKIKGCHLWIMCIVTELFDLMWHLVWLWQEPTQT